MLWVKALHVFSMVAWFAGIFYLPRLYVYHAMSDDKISIERFKIMERKLYYGIMAPSALFTIATGLHLLNAYAWSVYKSSGWLHVKLTLVVLLIAYHLYCGHLRKRFYEDNNTRSHVFYRWLNEVPVLLLGGIVVMVIVRPF